MRGQCSVVDVGVLRITFSYIIVVNMSRDMAKLSLSLIEGQGDTGGDLPCDCELNLQFNCTVE